MGNMVWKIKRIKLSFGLKFQSNIKNIRVKNNEWLTVTKLCKHKPNHINWLVFFNVQKSKYYFFINSKDFINLLRIIVLSMLFLISRYDTKPLPIKVVAIEIEAL